MEQDLIGNCLQPEDSFLNNHRRRFQAGSRAWPVKAEAVFDPEPRPMSGTENMPAIPANELIRRKIKRRSRMRTAVVIGKNIAPAADHDNVGVAPGWRGKTFPGTVGNFPQQAEPVVTHG